MYGKILSIMISAAVVLVSQQYVGQIKNSIVENGLNYFVGLFKAGFLSDNVLGHSSLRDFHVLEK